MPWRGRRPSAYPFLVEDVRVIQTHISAVFLAGPFAYKVKKPVNPGFLDFSTLDRRHHFCQEEVRLNRRLAPDVYVGVVPVVRADGGLRFEGSGEAVEWAVKMRRLRAPRSLAFHAGFAARAARMGTGSTAPARRRVHSPRGGGAAGRVREGCPAVAEI